MEKTEGRKSKEMLLLEIWITGECGWEVKAGCDRSPEDTYLGQSV